MFRHFVYGAIFTAAVIGISKLDCEADQVTEKIVLERAREIRKLHTPLSPSAEDCRVQGKQWIAYRNADQWAWIRECIDADLSRRQR